MGLLGDMLPGGKNGVTNLLGDVAKVGAVYSALFPTKPKPDPASEGDFTLSKFTAELNADARRIAKGYHYIAKIQSSGKFTNTTIEKELTFKCTSMNLPGWKAKTQVGKIYGLEYEIATGIEQDPLWLTFYIDIRHRTETAFMSSVKSNMFAVNPEFVTTSGPGSMSPKYKDKTQFNLVLELTDENFRPVSEYTLSNAIVKTVQQVQYGSDNIDIAKITVEIVYENISFKSVGSTRASAPPQPTAKDRNKLKLGPFQADISSINQITDGFGKIPDWFSTPEKI